MGLLRMSSGAGQEVRVLRSSRARNSAQGAAGAGFGLFVFAPSGQVTLGAVVQCPPETSDPSKWPESTLRSTAGSVSLSGCPSIHSHLCPPASVIHPSRPQARLSSPVRLSNRKSERVTRTPGRMRKISRRDSSRETGFAASGWAQSARLTSGPRRADPVPASRLLFPMQFLRRVVSGRTVSPGGLYACWEGGFGLCGRLEGRWRKE